jgi:hypothetical protein
MIRRLLDLFFQSRRKPRATWIPCKVSRRDYEWSIWDPAGYRDIADVDAILRIRSRDGKFDIAIGVTTYSGPPSYSRISVRLPWEYGKESYSLLGPLLVLGTEFPLRQDAASCRRVAFPGPRFVRYGLIHTALVQSIVQRCSNSRRGVKEVDKFGVPARLADRIADLASRPVHRFPINTAQEDSAKSE